MIRRENCSSRLSCPLRAGVDSFGDDKVFEFNVSIDAGEVIPVCGAKISNTVPFPLCWLLLTAKGGRSWRIRVELDVCCDQK
jgi:hypothetical protein